MGTNIRVYSLAKELHGMGCQIDLFAFRNFLSLYDDFDKMNEKEKIVSKLYLYDYKKTVAFLKRKKVQRCINKVLHNEELENWVTPNMIQQFDEIVTINEYDYIIMFYAYTGELVSPVNYRGTAHKIYFMEDLLSVAHFVSGRNKYIGRLLDSEVKRVSYFDKVVCISSDEKTLFEKLLPSKEFYFLPHLINVKDISRKFKNKIPRILFIGYDNEYNIEGMHWFFKNVYSQLLPDMEIILVGKVVKYVKYDYPNLRKVEYVENLDELYMGVDIVICPLQNGTGMKIKVVEAMSYSIPVVCTSRGVDGLPDKYKNGCLVENIPEKFAEAINLLSTNASFYENCQDNISRYFQEVINWDRQKALMAALFNEYSYGS